MLLLYRNCLRLRFFPYILFVFHVRCTWTSELWLLRHTERATNGRKPNTNLRWMDFAASSHCVPFFFLIYARCITMSTCTAVCHLCGGLTWFAWPTLNAGLLVFLIQNWCGLFTAYLNTALRLDRFHKRRHHGSGRCRLVMSKWKGSGSVTMIKMWFTWGRLL